MFSPDKKPILNAEDKIGEQPSICIIHFGGHYETFSEACIFYTNISAYCHTGRLYAGARKQFGK